MDHNATTALKKEVFAEMQNFTNYPLNASSVHHFGKHARNLLENARTNIAKALNINSKLHQIIFMSSGTEANNTVMNSFKDGEIFISSTEHPSVYTFYELDRCRILKVDDNGMVDLDDLKTKLSASTSQTKLVSVMYANNETGVINPIPRVVAIAKEYGAYVHSDCVQTIGKKVFDFESTKLDFATISSHKIGGPHGIAALVTKKDTLKPLIIGSGQEMSLRSGTENVIGAIGFAKAVEIAALNILDYTVRTSSLRNALESALGSKAVIVGQFADRLPNTSMLLMPNVDAQTQLIHFDMRGFAVSNGSACSSGKVKPSHVLRAIGYPDDLLKNGIRVSLDVQNTREEIINFAQAWIDIYATNN